MNKLIPQVFFTTSQELRWPCYTFQSKISPGSSAFQTTATAAPSGSTGSAPGVGASPTLKISKEILLPALPWTVAGHALLAVISLLLSPSGIQVLGARHFLGLHSYKFLAK